MCNYHLITKIIRDPKNCKQTTQRTKAHEFFHGYRPCHPTMVQGFIVSERTVIDTCVSDTYDSLRRSEIYFCGMYSLTSRLPVQRKAFWPHN